MSTLLQKLTRSREKNAFDCSSVMVVYQAEESAWRGFVFPYDITFEAESREKVIEVLKSMIESYIDGLKEYNNPAHLNNVPLTYSKDREKWNLISQDLNGKLMNKIRKIESTDYYAEVQLPA
jgi:predicted RNase H-like HicB family nuclease